VKNERYHNEEDINAYKNAVSHRSSKSDTLREKFNLIDEVQEDSLNNSSKYIFDKDEMGNTSGKLLSNENQFKNNDSEMISLNLANHSANQNFNIQLQKPKYQMHKTHFSSESQLVQFHKDLYEGNYEIEQSANNSIAKSKYTDQNRSEKNSEKSITSVINTGREEHHQKENTSLNASSLSYRRNCYSFVKVPSNNTIILCPNSFDSPKLHRIRLLVEKQKSESSFNSNTSEIRRKPDQQMNTEEDSLESDEILWQHKQKKEGRNHINISGSQEEVSENRVINYSRLSNIDYNDTSENKLKYGIPEESNENDSQPANKIFQSGDTDSEKKDPEIANKDESRQEIVIVQDKIDKDRETLLTGENCPENFDKKLNDSGDDINNKETNFNRFEKFNLSNVPISGFGDGIDDPSSVEEGKSANMTPQHRNTNLDIEADKDESNIEWQLTLNSDLSSKSNNGEPNSGSASNPALISRFDSQKKNSLGEIKEEEENSKHNSNNDPHKDEENIYKEEFIGSIEESNNDIVADILNENEMLKDFKIKPNEEANLKDISFKSRNNTLSNEKNIELIVQNSPQSEKNKPVIASVEVPPSPLLIFNKDEEIENLKPDQNLNNYKKVSEPKEG
jgi:hypothetical protein